MTEPTMVTNYLRGMLLKFMLWIEKKMHQQTDFTLNDPEWNELQNEANSIKRMLKKDLQE